MCAGREVEWKKKKIPSCVYCRKWTENIENAQKGKSCWELRTKIISFNFLGSCLLKFMVWGFEFSFYFFHLHWKFGNQETILLESVGIIRIYPSRGSLYPRKLLFGDYFECKFSILVRFLYFRIIGNLDGEVFGIIFRLSLLVNFNSHNFTVEVFDFNAFLGFWVD